jgi:hypothetical protein
MFKHLHFTNISISEPGHFPVYMTMLSVQAF